MPIISTSIPNMVNGVSQQPEALRLASQCEEAINCYPSVVEGLRKRPPTKHVAKIASGTMSEAAIHMINRDTDERYLAVITNGDLKVFGIDGSPKTVNFPNGKAYLNSTTPSTSFRSMTVADYTFILNTEVATAMLTELSPTRGTEAIVLIKQINYSTDYKVILDGFTATCTTKDGSVDNRQTSGNVFNYVTQAAAAEGLTADEVWRDLGWYATAHLSSGRIADFIRWSLVQQYGSTFTVTRQGPVLWIKRADGNDFTIKIEDSRSNTQMTMVKATAQRFSELPTVAPKDFCVEIIGDQSSNFDNYFVKFVPNNASATFDSGVWKETVKPGIKWKFDKATMPYALVREADGTFSFKQLDWGHRECGDEDSAPEPTFVGRKINDMFFHKNRLGFLSDENVVMSRAGSFFEFFPTTVTTSVDSDPVDVAASTSKVSILRYAVPFNENLLLFSDQSQFNFKSGDILSNDTASIDVMTEFESSMSAKPVGAGRTVFFAVDKGQFTGVREYYIETNTNTKDASDITVQVPKYIPQGVFKMACATNEEILLVLSKGQENAIFAYKYYWAGNEKMQSAWGKFTFPVGTRVLSVDFIDVTAYIVVQYPDGVYVEKLSCEPGRVDDYAPFEYYLDRKVREDQCVSVTFDNSVNETAFKLPYVPNSTIEVVTRHHEGPYLSAPGVALKVLRVVDDTVYVLGNHSAKKVYVGQKYEMRYRFSKQALKEDAMGGGQAIVGSGRLQIKFWTVVYDHSGYFKVEVTPQYRDTNTYPFTGRVIGSANSKIGSVNLESGRFRFPVMSLADRVTIDLVNDTYLPSRFLSGEWEAMYTIRSKRL